MEDLWQPDEKVYYIEGGVVLKGRVKRRLEAGETDYLLQSQKNSRSVRCITHGKMQRGCWRSLTPK